MGSVEVGKEKSRAKQASGFTTYVRSPADAVGPSWDRSKHYALLWEKEVEVRQGGQNSKCPGRNAY